jgi:flagellar biosynthesis/type III secretory pathway M-ring protein FliF/YscJ
MAAMVNGTNNVRSVPNRGIRLLAPFVRSLLILAAVSSGAILLTSTTGCCATSESPKDQSHQDSRVSLGPILDLKAAAKELRFWGIPTIEEPESFSVTVPAQQERLAALVLTASELYPDGRLRYEFLNDSQLNQTDQRARVQYMAVLQDVLAQTLMASPFINMAAVTITEQGKPWEFRLPERFIDAKASVVVDTADGRRLTPSQHLAIVRLVGAVLPGVEFKNVSVMDQDLNFYRQVDADAISGTLAETN